MATVHASLNGQGYTKDPTIIADEIFAESIYSRRSQSEINFGNIVSLDYIIEQYSIDPMGICSALETEYETLFSRHFDNVTVRATTDEPENQNYYNVNLKIRYSREGVNYDFARVISHYNGVLKQISELLAQ